MPAPRAAATHARKSVVPDPDLYNDSDDSDDHQPRTGGRGGGGGAPRDDSDPPQNKKSRVSTGRGLVRKGSKGPQPLRGSVTAEGGRRRSTRLSNEHPLDDAPPSTTTTTLNGTKPAKASRKRTKPDDRRASASASEDDGEGARRHADEPAAAYQSRPQSKRPRTEPGQPASSIQQSESAGTSAAAATGAAARPPRRAFIVCQSLASGQDRVESASFSLADLTYTQPRAAANLGARVNKPLSTYSAALVDPEAEQGGDDARPFLFSTNPPTPYAKGAAAREAAAEQARSTKGKVSPAVDPRRRATREAPASSRSGRNSSLTPYFWILS